MKIRKALVSVAVGNGWAHRVVDVPSYPLSPSMLTELMVLLRDDLGRKDVVIVNIAPMVADDEKK